MFLADFQNGRIVEVMPDGSLANVMTDVVPQGVAVDRAGDVFATDYGRGRVVERTPDGSEVVVATRIPSPTGMAIDSTGDLFVVSGYDGADDPHLTRISATGTQTRLPLSGLRTPTSVAVDAQGDIFVTDRGFLNSGTLWELTAGGQQIQVATGFNAAWQVATEADGSVLVADGGNHGGLIRINPQGQQSFVPGSPRSYGVAVDGAGSIYVSGDGPGIFRIAPDGTSTQLYSGLGGNQIAVYGWAPQQVTITSKPVSTTVGDTYQAVATGGDSGQPVVFSNGPSGSGCTVTPSGLVTFTHPGTCVVAADQAAGGDYSAAPQVTQSIAVAGRSQTVTFTSTPDSPRVGDTYQATATGGGSGQPVVFSTDPSSTGCTVTAGGLVRMTHAQQCVIAADQQAGGDYAAADRVVQSFAVGAGVQAVTFSSQPPTAPRVGDAYRATATGGGSGQPVVFSADASSSGCTVTRSGLVTMTHAGQCEVVADQAGDADYDAAATSDQVLSVGQAGQQILFTSLPTHPEVGTSYDVTASGGGSNQPVVFSADPSSTGCSVTPEGAVTMVQAGQCVIAADQAGDADYAAAPQALQSFDVGQAQQTISFTADPARWAVGKSYRVTAEGGPSGQLVVFSTSPSSQGCSVTPEGVVTATHAQTCVIAADQAGDDDFAAAPQVLLTRRIERGKQSVRITSTAPHHPRSCRTYRVAATGGGSGHAVRIAVRGACTVRQAVVTFARPGRCTVTAIQTGGPDWLRGSATQRIEGIRR